MSMLVFGKLALLLSIALSAPQSRTDADSVRIVSITPAGPLTRGVPITLSVVVDADLESSATGIVQLGLNDDAPGRFRMQGSRPVVKGHTRITFTARTIPVDWGSEGRFTILVNVGPPIRAARWVPTARVQQPLDVKP